MQGIIDTKVKLGRTISDAFTNHGNEIVGIGQAVAGKTVGLVQVTIVFQFTQKLKNI